MCASRNITFDIMKGFLIILVVIGHAIQVTYRSTDMNVWLNPVFNFIYTFHMPLFIFVSGIFFKSSLRLCLADFVKKKAKRLLLPTMVFTSILLSIYVLINGSGSLQLKFVYAQFQYYWFCICLFILTLLHFFFYKSNKYIKLFLFLAYLGGVILYDYLPGVILKDCQIIRQTLIFFGGTCFSIFGGGKIILHQYVVLTFCVITIVFDRYLFGFNMMDYPIYIRIIDQLACSMLMFELLYSVITNIKDKDYIHPFVYLGQNSLAIYLIHMLFPRLMLYIHFMVPYNTNNILMLILIWFLVSVAIIEILKRILKSYSYVLGV